MSMDALMAQVSQLSLANEVAVAAAARCGCYFCTRVFESSMVREWVSDAQGRTAVCPHCGVDAVIAETEQTGALSRERLQELRAHWFEEAFPRPVDLPAGHPVQLQVGTFVRVKADAEFRAGQDGMVTCAGDGLHVGLVFGYDRNNTSPDKLGITYTGLTEEWSLTELDLASAEH